MHTVVSICPSSSSISHFLHCRALSSLRFGLSLSQGHHLLAVDHDWTFFGHGFRLAGPRRWKIRGPACLVRYPTTAAGRDGITRFYKSPTCIFYRTLVTRSPLFSPSLLTPISSHCTSSPPRVPYESGPSYAYVTLRVLLALQA